MLGADISLIQVQWCDLKKVNCWYQVIDASVGQVVGILDFQHHWTNWERYELRTRKRGASCGKKYGHWRRNTMIERPSETGVLLRRSAGSKNRVFHADAAETWTSTIRPGYIEWFTFEVEETERQSRPSGPFLRVAAVDPVTSCMASCRIVPAG